MQKRELSKVEGVLFASYELENDDFKKKVLKEAKSLKDRPEGLATRGYIFQKTKSGLHTSFVARMERLKIGLSIDFNGVRYKRVSESLFVGEDIYILQSRYRYKKMNVWEEST